MTPVFNRRDNAHTRQLRNEADQADALGAQAQADGDHKRAASYRRYAQNSRRLAKHQ